MKENIKFALICVIIGLLLFESYLLIFNRELFCKIAFIGQISQVPAFCIEDALKEISK